jgi:hypothetical protein
MPYLANAGDATGAMTPGGLPALVRPPGPPPPPTGRAFPPPRPPPRPGPRPGRRPGGDNLPLRFLPAMVGCWLWLCRVVGKGVFSNGRVFTY